MMLLLLAVLLPAAGYLGYLLGQRRERGRQELERQQIEEQQFRRSQRKGAIQLNTVRLRR